VPVVPLLHFLLTESSNLQICRVERGVTQAVTEAISWSNVVAQEMPVIDVKTLLVVDLRFRVQVAVDVCDLSRVIRNVFALRKRHSSGRIIGSINYVHKTVTGFLTCVIWEQSASSPVWSLQLTYQGDRPARLQ
jgi:hypothetical protein